MTAKSIADILDAAADLITPEGAWTQWVGRRDAAGKVVASEMARDPTAVCWCIGGALLYVMDKPVPGTPVAEYLDKALNGNFVEWNDAPGRTQAEVIAKLRERANALRTSTPGEA